ncbi:MAG: hypothetical protein Q8K69_01080 [Bacteroidota bacterium]|nr:hypothetical protein [Bacteroidota bacterium]
MVHNVAADFNPWKLMAIKRKEVPSEVLIPLLSAFSFFPFRCQYSVCIEEQSIQSCIVFGSVCSTNQNGSEIPN